MHRSQLLLEFTQMLLMNDILNDVVARPVLPLYQTFYQLMPGKQGLHLSEALLQVFSVGKLGVFCLLYTSQRIWHNTRWCLPTTTHNN